MSSSFLKKFSALLIPTLVLVVLLYEFWSTPIYSDRELASMRESAVTLAREGNTEAALEKLRALFEVAPNDRAIFGDYLTELVRAGRDDEALNLFRQHRTKPLPDYALAELFDAALRQHDVDLARELADREIAQSANRADVAAARERALLDSRVAPVSQETELITASEATTETTTTTVATTSGEKSDAVRPLRSAPKSTPRNYSSKQNMESSPSRNQAPLESQLSKSQIQDEQLSLAERARNAVREAEHSSASERTTRALAALPLVKEYEASLSGNTLEKRNANLDLVRALTLANRYDEAAALFESLGDPEQLPFYGVMHGADLYTRRHKPERAEPLLRIAEKMQPDSRELLVAQFYNQLDLEQYDRAAQKLERLRENSNDDVTQRDTEIISALFAAYQNRLNEAQTRLENLQRLNPDNTDIQLRLAQIYRWRGWPRRALDNYRSIENSTDPISAPLGEIAALNDLHADREADERLQQLVSTAPNHPEVNRAQQEYVQRNRWDYSAQVLAGKSNDSPVTGSGNIAFEQKLYSPPIANQFRAFAHQRYDWADFPEGSGSANRLGVGGDYRSENIDASAEISHRNPNDKVGLTLNGEWKLDDRLSLFGEVQTDSNLIPLRALNADIDGHSATVGALYRADESHALRASYSRADFSDGNQRDAVMAQYEQNLFSDAHHQLKGVVQGYYSDNSAGNDVPYFNPASEKVLGAVLKYDGILWRRYERNWSHYLNLGAGNYWQKDFDSGVIWDIEYGQRWQLSQALSINYGLLYRSRIYDGDREGYGAILGGLNWRF